MFGSWGTNEKRLIRRTGQLYQEKDMTLGFSIHYTWLNCLLANNTRAATPGSM